MNKEEQEIRKKSPVQIRNKKASFEYFFVDTYTAGIVLTGTEIKSIRKIIMHVIFLSSCLQFLVISKLSIFSLISISIIYFLLIHEVSHVKQISLLKKMVVLKIKALIKKI